MGGGRKADEAMDTGGKVEGFNVFRWMDRWAEGEKQMKQWIQEILFTNLFIDYLSCFTCFLQ